MTEREYRIEERLGIVTDGRREPTPEEIKQAEKFVDVTIGIYVEETNQN
jgi:hypothetical protein